MAKRVNRDDAYYMHEYGIYIPNRTIYIGSQLFDIALGESGTDGLMAARTIKNLMILESMSQEPITILMNNLGGIVVDGLAIYDAIRDCKSHITIKVFGFAASMGSVILQAADVRIMAPMSKQLIHYGSTELGGHAKEVEKWVEDGRKDALWLEHMYLEHIRTKHPSFKLSKLRKMLSFDTILNAHEAVELGLADKVLGEEEEG